VLSSGVMLELPPMAKTPNTEAREHYELEFLRLLARGEKEIEAGRGYDLDAVLAEADALLRELQG